MNGRIYDPVLGSFLSADPFIQFPDNLQSYNRYSYVLNNPGSFTDPSGYFIFALIQLAINITINIAAIVATQIAAAAIAQPWLFAASVALGAYTGYQNGGGIWGALRGALFAAIGAGIAFNVGHGSIGTFLKGTFKDYFQIAKAVAHGISQGVISEIRGGDFGSAFMGSLAASGMNFGLDKAGLMKHAVSRTISAAVVGGTVAEMGGGKFANGAASAAFVTAFNEFGTAAEHWSGDRETEKRVDQYSKEAAKAIEGAARATRYRGEWYILGEEVVTEEGRILVLSDPIRGLAESISGREQILAQQSLDSKLVDLGLYSNERQTILEMHSHPPYASSLPSPADIENATVNWKRSEMRSYIYTMRDRNIVKIIPDGNVRKFWFFRIGCDAVKIGGID